MFRIRLCSRLLLLSLAVVLCASCSEPTPKSTNGSSASSSSPSPSSSATPSSNARVEPWTVDASLLEQLDAPQQIDAFEIRPPRGYTLAQTPPVPTGGSAWAWASEPRPDGTRGMVMVMIVTPPTPADAKGVDADVFLDKMLAGIKRQRSNFQETAVEHGDINRITFARKRWSGLEPRLQKKMHGFDYAAQIGNQFILLRSQDVEPFHEAALPLAEAAAMSFRKR